MASEGDDQDQRSIWEALSSYQKSAEWLVLLVLGAYMGLVRIQGISAGQTTPEMLVGWLKFALLPTAIVLTVFWWRDTDSELRQLKSVASGLPMTLDLPSSGWTVTLLAAAGLAVLILLSVEPLTFAVALLALKTVEFWGSWLAKSKIRAGIKRIDHLALGISSEKREAVQVLDFYYFEHPWDALGASEMLVATIAAVVATGPSLDPTLRPVAVGAACVLLISAVAANEIVAAIWRRQRDRELPSRYRA